LVKHRKYSENKRWLKAYKNNRTIVDKANGLGAFLRSPNLKKTYCQPNGSHNFSLYYIIYDDCKKLKKTSWKKLFYWDY
jgi:hypothetical protein